MTLIQRDPQSGSQRARDEVARNDWLDRLVGLHVLTGSGDQVAAAEARHWLQYDATARTVWDEVEHTCDQLGRSHPPSAVTP